MASFKPQTVALCLLAVAATSLSAPWPQVSRHATHRTRSVRRRDSVSAIQVEIFHPPSTYETFGTAGIDHPLSKRAEATLEESAISFVQSRRGIPVETITYHSGFDGQVASHAYVRQSLNNISFANAVANVAFNKDHKIVAFGSSFVNITNFHAPSPSPSIPLAKAISIAESTLNGAYNPDVHPSPTLSYLVISDGSVSLVHSMQIENEETGMWYNAYVDAHSGELRSVVDFVMQASYLGLPYSELVPAQGFQTIVNPMDNFSSPLGWHSDGNNSYTATTGNNALAFKTIQTMLTSQSSNGLNFIYPQDPTVSPSTQGNVDAARTNAFYLVNMVHDISYRYGFTETSFNFQVNNFGKGGKGSDEIQINVQSNAGINNADFATPPDGQFGKMRQFLWYYSSPERDGSLENDIVIHENTHGITNRMTGGGSATCLQTLEAGGLAEGWSDAMADWSSQISATVPDFAFGTYVVNSPAGMRTHPYSINSTINPLMYADIASLNEPHYIGEIWANTLHNVYVALVESYGFSKTAHTDPTGTEGN
ncbi:hypothetical protein V5O48_016076, partial [Marasmius crinis-equi]